MKKQDMTIGEQYKVKHSYGRPMILLAIGGYADRYVTDEERAARVFVKPYVKSSNRYSRETEGNLMLRVNVDGDEVLDAATLYTEADYLAGKPVPEGTALVAIGSGRIEYLWEQHLEYKEAADRRAAERAKSEDFRKNVLLPKVRAELERLGLKQSALDYSTKVEFSLTEFLALASQIATPESK